MTDHTVTALFEHYGQVEDALLRLEALGVPHTDMAIVASHSRETPDTSAPGSASIAGQAQVDAAEKTGRAAVVGGLVGGGAGLLAGLGMLSVPGLGPILTAGWLAASLTGAGIGVAAGGLIGGLTALGMTETEAAAYEEGVRRGGTLITVKIDEARVEMAKAVLKEAGSVDIEEQTEDWRAAGWTGGIAG